MSEQIGRGGKVYTRVEAGEGIGFEYAKLKPDMAQRIEALGVLNDRRVMYAAAGDWMSLLALADEYELKRMPIMAEQIRKDAYECNGYNGSEKPEGRKPESRKAERRADGGKRTGRAVGKNFA